MVVIEGLNNIGLTVSNLDISIKFYKELFDFEVVEKIDTSGQAILKIADIKICLYEVEGYKNQAESKFRISFLVDEEDFEDILDELESLSIEVIYGPENIRNGRLVVFIDPDGNQLELSYSKN